MSDLAAAARILTALADALDSEHDVELAAELRALATSLSLTGQYARDVAAALLDAARREVAPRPRVWLPGEEIPADTYVVDQWGDVTVEGHPLTVWVHTPGKSYVEVLVPDFATAVAAEQTRRAATEGGVAE